MFLMYDSLPRRKEKNEDVAKDEYQGARDETAAGHAEYPWVFFIPNWSAFAHQIRLSLILPPAQ